ncbi:MAG: YraN family protein [Caldisericia bacterium]|nr:YraN family protein [Caldisericia bacterium]MDD4613915.1 YraN family protein [Caldisericia bacterium]
MKHSTRHIGSHGELIAKNWLRQKGFEIVEMNYHGPYGEIDIVAQKGGTLHFIEVKTRLSTQFGTPSESITRQKCLRIRKTVYRYLDEKKPSIKNFQIDFIGIQKGSDNKLLLTYLPSIT